MDGRLNVDRRNKAAFSNLSGVVWKGPQIFDFIANCFLLCRISRNYF